LERFKQEQNSGNQDFIYPPLAAGAMNGIGGPEVMTKAPWAK